MKIFLIRHAHAIDGRDDAARPLSRRGRDQVRKVARFLRHAEIFGAEEVWHSPLVRSRETAALLRQRLRRRTRLREVAGLLHEDDPRIMADRLDKTRRPVAVVGHEPHLSALASLIVTGKAHPPRFDLRKAAVLALVREGKGWQVAWQISPAILR